MPSCGRPPGRRRKSPTDIPEVVAIVTGSQPKSSYYDVIVVGAGPAGLSAAVNVANRKRTVAVFDGVRPFSYARKAPQIPNYPGFSFATGEELAASFLEHAERFDVPIFKERVTRILPGDGELYLSTDVDTYTAGAVILATGVSREAQIEGEEELVGRGVSYCVNCDGRLYAGRDVVVVGYAPEGEQEAAVLAEDMGAQVTYLPLYEGDYDLPEEVAVLPEHRPDRLCREDRGVRVVLPDRELHVDGVFIYKESVSPKSIIDGLRFDGRHIAVDRGGWTGIEGVWAAGDCTGDPYQIAKAVGEGQVAALQAVRHVREVERRRQEEATAAAAEPEGRGAAQDQAQAGADASTAASAGEVAARGRAGTDAERQAGGAHQAISDKDRENLRGILEKMGEEVRLVHFTQLGDGRTGLACAECDEARALVSEFAELSPKLRLEVHDFMEEHDLAEEYGVERIPATLVAGPGQDRPRVRLFGVPGGYEFGPFLDDILEVSRGELKLRETTRTALAELDGAVHLEVLTTPTCPNCPAAVRLAHRFAMASPQVTADMIIATEFPELAQRYEVAAVPKVMVNGAAAPSGVLDEDRLLELVLGAGAARA